MKTRTRLLFGLAAMALGSIALPACSPAHSDTAEAESSAADGVDLTALPLGDGRVTTSGPKRGYVYSCSSGGDGGGAFQDGPWIHDNTYDLTAKATVDGSVSWDNARVRFKTSKGKLKVTGNGLPVHTNTGSFPISSSDNAYQYDRNPNSIQSQTVSYKLPAKPRKARRTSCVGMGPIGVSKNGVAIFNALDAAQRDAVAHEVQDKCDGHPQQQGQYHYHGLSSCLFDNESTSKHSKLFGYALDGFAIYGPRGKHGKLLTNSDLDSCHGHTHTIKVHGKRKRVYHYHATYEYPYTIGCYRGTPASDSRGDQGGGQAPGGTQPPGGALPGGGPPQGPPPSF